MVKQSLFWLSEEAWAALEPHLPHGMPGQATGRRSQGDLRHSPRVESWLPLAGCSC